MKWFRIAKELSKKPAKGKHYFDWKEYLSNEGKEQCVYCAININSFGGIRNFHVEHYRPKAADKFPALTHDISNLYFACSICNCFKGDDWPCEPSKEFDILCYPDPSVVDYSSFLFVNENSFIDSKYLTGKYIIQKLFLNRPQLVLERKSFLLHNILKQESLKLKEILAEIKNTEGDNPIVEGYVSALETVILLIQEKYINPYAEKQIER